METRAGDPGAFAHFDLNLVDSPAFVVDAAKLRDNLRVLADIRDRAGIKVLSALKAFSMWSVAPTIGEYLDGVCTSGLWEALLAAEHYDGEIATYCAAYKEEDMEEILRLSDHVIFNTPMQHERFRPQIEAARNRGESFDVGLRINPMHAEGEVPRYDPCAPHSRFICDADEAGLEKTRVSSQFIDGEGLRMATIGLIQQSPGPHKRGKYPASVDVPYQYNGCGGMAGHLHIDDVAVAQIDFGGTAGAFQHHHVKCIGQPPKGLLHRGPILTAHRTKVLRAQRSGHLACDDKLCGRM